ncbi:MAG: hypothetical protein NW215_00680 [Hyphomicrobiales bacterium]|nr:hypothetical protein [Hyphomicrobiales bacterium]
MSARRIQQLCTLLILFYAAPLILALRTGYGIGFGLWLWLAVPGGLFFLGLVDGFFELNNSHALFGLYATESLLQIVLWGVPLLCLHIPLTLAGYVFDTTKPPLGSIGRPWMSFGQGALLRIDVIAAPALLAVLYVFPRTPSQAIDDPFHFAPVLAAYYLVLALAEPDGVIPWFHDGSDVEPLRKSAPQRLSQVAIAKAKGGGGGLPGIIQRRAPELKALASRRDPKA